MFSRIILGFIVFTESKVIDTKKVEAFVNMLVPTTLQEVQMFNGMAQFYKCFIKNFASTMSPITKLFKNSEVFEWTKECKNSWEDIKNRYAQASILIKLGA
jgi:hypothetical protein